MLHTLQITALHLLWRTLARHWQPHRIPILGSIIAGRPELQDPGMDCCLDVDAEILRLPKNARTFALKCVGDSMTGAGILEGDGRVGVFEDAIEHVCIQHEGFDVIAHGLPVDVLI